jgi:hypothetical protein
VRDRSTDEFEIIWERNSNCVILALEKEGVLPPAEPEARHRLRVSPALPQTVVCNKETSGG